MTTGKELFTDKSLSCGGFYELAIQVCASIDNEPIIAYTNHIWSLANVNGPFDDEFNRINVNIETFSHRGIIRLSEYEIPFMTYNVRETYPIETGFNWFDICFYSAAIEHIFSEEYQTWTAKPKVPKEVSELFTRTMKDLYKIYPFKLAMTDFEISGRYYLDDLQNPLGNNWESSTFFVGEANFGQIAKENQRIVTKIEEL